jgi:hypothetical protein
LKRSCTGRSQAGINGNEAAVHHRNRIVGTDTAIDSIETYHFEPGGLFVRYSLLPPPDNK